MQDAQIAFIRTGEPASASLPAWLPYGADRRTVMRFGRVTAPADDPLQHWRDVWCQLDGRQR